MALARVRRESGFNYWPGFVDALSTLVLSIVFLLSVFLVVQFFLSQEVSGKDKALMQLNAKIAELNDLLSLEKLGKINLEDALTQVRAGLASAESERDRQRTGAVAQVPHHQRPGLVHRRGDGRHVGQEQGVRKDLCSPWSVSRKLRAQHGSPRKDASGAWARMPLKSQKKRLGVPVENTFDFFLLIGGHLGHLAAGIDF